jgi:ribonuclease J
MVSSSVPCLDRPEIRVYASSSQYKRLKTDPGYFGDFSKRLFRCRVESEELHASPEAFLYIGKMSSFRLIGEFTNTDAPVNIIYSQWLGYLDGNHANHFGSDRISAFRSDPVFNFVYAHTSGHAPVKDLQRLATTLNPRKLAPIHTERSEDFSQIFANVVTLNDSEVFDLL